MRRTMLPLIFYIAGSLCFLAGSVIALFQQASK
jgi:hypothetical protein